MPYLAPSICACGRVVAPGQRCACRILADRERNAANDAKRPSARQRGYDRDWDRERVLFLRANPKCRFCGATANVVDHVIPHKGDKRLFWNRSNWAPLCTHCHCSTKQRHERATQR